MPSYNNVGSTGEGRPLYIDPNKLPKYPNTVIESVFGSPNDTSPNDAYKRFEAVSPPSKLPMEASNALTNAIKKIPLPNFSNIGIGTIAVGFLILLILIGVRR